MRGKIESNSSGEHDAGMQELQAIRDPAAIEALVATFKNRPDLLCEAIRVIGQMPGQEATDALLQQAVLSKHSSVRMSACDELKTRSVYGYVPKLIAALSTPVQTKFEMVRDRGAVHFRKTIQREGGQCRCCQNRRYERHASRAQSQSPQYHRRNLRSNHPRPPKDGSCGLAAQSQIDAIQRVDLSSCSKTPSAAGQLAIPKGGGTGGATTP